MSIETYKLILSMIDTRIEVNSDYPIPSLSEYTKIRVEAFETIRADIQNLLDAELRVRDKEADKWQ